MQDYDSLAEIHNSIFAWLTFYRPQLNVGNSDVASVREDEWPIYIIGLNVAEETTWVWIKCQQGMSCVDIDHVHAIDLELRLVEL